MHSVCCCRLTVRRRSSLKKGTPNDLFWPALDPPLGGSGGKTTTLVRDHEYFIPTTFHQNPSVGSGEEVENVRNLRLTDGRCAMTIAHSSFRLRWAKKCIQNIYWHVPESTILRPNCKRALKSQDLIQSRLWIGGDADIVHTTLLVRVKRFMEIF